MAERESHLPVSVPGSPALDELGNHCFGCGEANPEGLHLVFALSTTMPQTATAVVNLTRRHEGPPGYIHGGILATLMDEAMSKLNRPLDVLAMTRHLEVDYLRPAPLGVPLRLVGTHVRREGRKLFHRAELLGPDGALLVRAAAVFIVIDAAHLAAARGEA